MRGLSIADVLIAGGTGFIGSHLVARLNRSNQSVVVVDAHREYATPVCAADRQLRSKLLANASVEQIDLLDQSRVIACVQQHQPRVIVNLASNPLVAAADLDPSACEKDIVQSARLLSAAISKCRSVKRLVHVSSSMVYGDFKSKTAPETHALRPINAYGRMKLAAEHAITALGQSSSVEIVIVRPMAVFGPGDHYQRVIPVFCTHALAGRTLQVRAGASSADYTYVDDVTDALERAAFEPKAAGEVFNVSSGKSLSLLDVVAEIRRQVPSVRFEMAQSDGVVRPRRGSLDIRKAKRLLGFEPKFDFQSGLAQCLAAISEPKAPMREPKRFLANPNE